MPLRRTVVVGSLAILGGLVAGCSGSDAGSAVDATLKGTLEAAGIQNPLTTEPTTYEGRFRLKDGAFECAILPHGSYCVTTDKTAEVAVSDSGGVTSGQTGGTQSLPSGETRTIGSGDVIVNKPGTIACGSEEGRGLWCIAIKPGLGFLTDGSSSGFTRLHRN